MVHQALRATKLSVYEFIGVFVLFFPLAFLPETNATQNNERNGTNCHKYH